MSILFQSARLRCAKVLLVWKLLCVRCSGLAKAHKFVGLARTIYIQYIYGVFGREIIKYTVIYGIYTVLANPTSLHSDMQVHAHATRVHVLH